MDKVYPTAEEIVLDVMRHFGFRRNYQVAEYFEVTPQTLSGWIKSGKIPPRHLMKYTQEVLNAESGYEPNVVANNTPAIATSPELYLPLKPWKFSPTALKQALSQNLHIALGTPIITTFILAFYFFFIADPVYSSIAKVLPISEDGSNTTGFTGMATQLGLNIPLNLSNTLPWGEVYPEIVQSEALLSGILDQPFKTRKYGNRALKEILVAENRLDAYSEPQKTVRATNALKKWIQVTKDRLSPSVTLEVGAFEPQLAMEVARVVIEKSSQSLRRLRTNRISKKRAFIDERLTEVSNELDHKQKELEFFQETNRKLISPSLQIKDQILQREVDLHSSLYITLKTQYEKAKIDEVEQAQMVQLIDGPTLPVKLTRPRRALGIGMSLFFGVFLGLFIIYFKENLLEPDPT
ncbi:MAG: GNVR domain-containing protein [Candidatus Marinimicrobia bacterium]|jgi:capsular polysaccharide biosynthesis protein|nr:GNVR domain-containing protein [Candidatus Neomarinimicrobiota bacterium]MDP6615164.1 GNVR domain-containing protein [Candidatus Neomarinimicrobiota bacterium]|tara:strand:+ start:773 stop:1996 length:1224 start_codon:yes stop_codon:yes gene_type:complete